MEFTSQRKKIIAIVFAVLVVALGSVWLILHPRPSNEEMSSLLETQKSIPSNLRGITVPEKDSNVSSDIAKPIRSSSALPSGEITDRTFSLRVDNGSFLPDTVIVHQSDTVTIGVEAIDKAYDFTLPSYGFHFSIPRGSAKNIKFAASALGQFRFYCEACGGPQSGPQGTLIVVPRGQ